jgi:hypothetical protein
MADGSDRLTADAEQDSKGQTMLETEHERQSRLTSLRIIYFTMFLMTLGFSIILTGIWPYLDKVRLIVVFVGVFDNYCLIIFHK